MPERHVEQSARSGHLHIRSDHRFSAADRRPHRFPEHWVDARTSMLHFATHWDVVFSRCQQELSGLAQTKKGDIKFVADNPDAGYPVSSLVSNEDRPNISVQYPERLTSRVYNEPDLNRHVYRAGCVGPNGAAAVRKY